MNKLLEKINITYLAIATVLSLPIVFLSVIAGVISFFWLLAAGQWKAIGAGIVFAAIMPFVVGIVCLPTLPASVKMISLNSEKQFFLSTVLALIVSLYSNGCLAGWVYFVFTFMVNNSVSNNLLIPMICWTFLVINMPISSLFRSQKDETEALIHLSICVYICFATLTLMKLNGIFSLETYVFAFLFTTVFNTLSLLIFMKKLKQEDLTTGWEDYSERG